MLKSKITYGWVIAGIFLSAIRVLSASFLGTTSGAVTLGLSDFIFIWSMLIIGISASAIASESGELADSIMSKSVKRYDYILAKFASRICYVVIVYLLIAAALLGASLRISINDYDAYGLAFAILFFALTLIMLTSIGVALSTFASNTVIPIVVLLILWYSMTFFFPLLDPSLSLLSPSSLISQMPDIIQGTYSGEEWKTAISLAAISIAAIAASALYFSEKDL